MSSSTRGRPSERGIPAAYKYQAVRYFPFDVGPGDSYVLTGDPWSYVNAWLSQKTTKHRGAKRKQLERAIYYVELAESFYKAAYATPLPAQGTLTYYGMLNLVKAFLSVRGTELETTWEHHGLTLPQGTAQQVQIQAPANNGSICIFAEFARELGTPIKVKRVRSVAELASNIPEIQQITASLGHLPWKKRKFLPVRVEFAVNVTKTHVFTEIGYEKKNETAVDTARFMKGRRAKYFRAEPPRGDWLWFRSKARKKVNQKNWPIIYRNICREYSEFEIASLLTRNGYLYYCDLRPGPVHHLGSSLALMFYVGTIARYRPTEMQVVMSGDLRPVVAEAIATCPRQFLYQLVSRMTGSVCVVPQARI